MPMTEPRGARDLAELWRALPAGVLSYPLAALPDLAALSDTLRARAWRERCAAPAARSCAEQGQDCPLAGTGACRADGLFPMHLGGGAPQWRMATLFLQWWPSHGRLFLIALGEAATAELGWAARCLRERHGLEAAERLPVTRFAELEVRGWRRLRLNFVTPWVVSKGERAADAAPDAATVARELSKAMRARAHKFTALCARDAVWQRLGGHLAHHVADRLLPDALTVERVELCLSPPAPARSRANGQRFEEVGWLGAVTLAVDEAALPWLSLLAVCGGGENADKGRGRVELAPLPAHE